MADIKINGVTPTGIYVGSTAASAVYLGNVKVWEPAPSMANNTLKFRFSDTSYDPSSLTTLTGATWTQISSSPNVWLWDASNVQTTDWSTAFYRKWTSNSNQVELIDAGVLTKPITLSSQSGSTYYGLFAQDSYLVSVCPLSFPNATDCARLFHKCTNLAGSVSISCPSATTISDCFGGSNTDSNNVMTSATITTSSSLVTANQVFRGCKQLRSFSISNTSSVTNFGYMCTGCKALQTVPLLATGAATIVTNMFYNCNNVASGALALYTQMSTQTTPPATHTDCFKNCGSNTVTGAAELAQIPTTWGGTRSGFTATSVGSNLYNAWDDAYCFKSQRITVPAGVSLSATASFVWDNTDHENTHGSVDADGGKAFLVLANPSDSTKYVVGTGLQGTWLIYDEWSSAITLPVTWGGTLSSMFSWGNLTMDDLRDTSGNVDIYVCCTYSGGTPISGSATGGYFNTIFECEGDVSDEGSVITVTVS